MALLFADSLLKKNSRVVQNSIKLLEVMLISAGLISTVVMVKGAVVPYSCEIVLSSLVGLWNSIRCLLSSPLFICIIINFTVMLIAVSSTFHRQETTGFQDEDDDINNVISVADMDNIVEPSISIAAAPPPSPNIRPHIYSTQQTPIDKFVVTKLSESHKIKKDHEAVKVKEDEVMSSTSDEEDTMDATWKAITGGGKQRSKKIELKKSETWDVPPRRTSVHRLDSEEVMPTTPKWRDLRKAETFNDAVSITLRGGLRRDPSMSLDEFNKQVDAFINKFKMEATR